MGLGAPESVCFSPDQHHRHLYDLNKPKLAYRDNRTDYAGWKAKVAAKLNALLGDAPAGTPSYSDFRIETTTRDADKTSVCFIIRAEEGVDVPCILAIPGDMKGAAAAAYPVIICLQGHSSGMHISLGDAKFAGDVQAIAGHRDFALEAVRHGYAAVAIEQRSLGERSARPPAGSYPGCDRVSAGASCY